MCVGACRCVLRAHSNAHKKIHALSQQHDCAGMRVTSTCTQTGYIHFHEKPRQFGEIDWANGGLVTSCRTLTIPRPCRQTLNVKYLQTRADALVNYRLFCQGCAHECNDCRSGRFCTGTQRVNCGLGKAQAHTHAPQCFNAYSVIPV